MKTIEPHQTVRVDLRALRDNQVPDYFEQLIPSTTSRGQFQWTLITGDQSPESDPFKSLALIGRSEQVDIVRGISSNYACQNCCSDNVAGVGIVPGNTVDSLNTTREFAAIEQRVDCYGQTYPVRITSNVTWSSSNTSVATINSLGWATTHNPGTTNISASWSRNGVMENPDQCEPQLGPSKEEPDETPLLPACGTCLTFHAVMNASVGYQVTSCAVTIEEETISPNNLPQDSVRNPARIRRLFAPVFEATVTGGSASACPVSWVVAGPGQIVGAANNPLLTVNGNAVGDLLLKVTTFGGRFDDLIVPVVNQRDVDVRVWIVRSTDGTVSAATQTRISDEIAMANKIWEQCGVQFTLRSTSFLNSSTFLDPPDQATKDLLRNTNAATGGIEVYYVRNLLGEPGIVGSTNPTGVIVTAGANSRTLAHELGHAMGLPGNPHRPSATANVSLMHALFSATIADIVLGECTALSTFSSN